MNAKFLFTALLAVGITSASIAAPAQACMARPPEPEKPAVLHLDSDSPFAALAQPIRMTLITRHGQQFWRAIYEVVAVQDGPVPNQRVIVEWGCDPVENPGSAACIDLVNKVVPGFDVEGHADARLVQLELRHPHRSGFDGVTVYSGSRLSKVVQGPISVRRGIG